MVTNEGDNRYLWVTGRGYGATRMVDDMGNEYKINTIQLANQIGGYDGLRHLLIFGVPTKLVLSFEGVSRNAKGVSYLDIHCLQKDLRPESVWYGSDFKVQLRNIPLSR